MVIKSDPRRKDMKYKGRLVLFCTGILLCLSTVSVPASEKAALRGVGQFEVPGWFKRSFLELNQDVIEAAREGKRLMVYFGQDGCPYCAALFNNNFSQPHILEYTRRHFDAVEINIWGSREVTDFSGTVLPEKEFAAKQRVRFTPTLLFFNEKSEVVLRLNGYYPPHQFLAALQFAAEKQETKMSFREYLAKHAPLPSRGVLNRKTFFAKPPYDLDKKSPGKPVAVLFEQKDCAGCDQLHDEILVLPETLKQLKHYDVIQLDRWSSTPVTTPGGKRTTARQWAEDLNIAYVPTIVLFDDGKEAIRIEALNKSFHVQSVLDYVASGAYRNQPQLQRFIQQRADHLRAQGVEVDIWK
jgi:thioredoxin-related protein